MKTIVIWQDFQELPTFIVLEGNYSHLDGVVIGTVDDEEKQEELASLLWDPDSGDIRVKYVDNPPYHVLTEDGYIIIRAGLVP